MPPVANRSVLMRGCARHSHTVRFGRTTQSRYDSRNHTTEVAMTKVEQLAREIQNLSAKELTSFRTWFAAFDAAVWDEQIADDAKAGRFDRLADTALTDHRAGRSRKL
jgi:hypothetical protein